MDSHRTEAFTLMFDRPLEPLFMPKGPDSNFTFLMPDGYLKSRHRRISEKIKKRFAKKGVTTIAVKNISLPDLTVPMQLGRTENFSLFIPKHRDIASKMIDIFMKVRSCSDLISVAAYCRERLNPYLFNYAMSVTLLHRPDTRDVVIPNFMNSFPAKFVDSKVFMYARQEASVIPDDSREPIVLAPEFTANKREPEQAVAYFREDIGVNLHHWHWHLVYPGQAEDKALVAKDRRGELFYYMHLQILARFNAERFCNELPKLLPFYNLNESITEAYFPKLGMGISSRAWPPRFKDTVLSDIDRPDDKFAMKKEVLSFWMNNLNEAVSKGVVINEQGASVPLDEISGIDILGNLVEATTLSLNRNLYGDLHNLGHIFIALCHDYDGRYLESFSVMGDTATAMRDPIFYRWHTAINDIFLAHKSMMPKYTIDQLNFPDITITDVDIEVPHKSPNELFTFWEQSDVDMSRGLDFSPSGPVLIRFTHLQHEDYVYTIKVNNASAVQVFGTVRIFLIPKFDEKGKQIPFRDQRISAIELDKFKVPLKPGANVITRKSLDSSVTIPYNQTFRNLDSERPTGGTALQQFNFCGCGWPQHMLIPKGTVAGMPYELFVMVSNYEADKIVQDTTSVCDDAYSYCGVLDKLYPDKRSMGYPFDRVPREGVTSLNSFLTTNMILQEVVIFFTEKTVLRQELPLVPDYEVVSAKKPRPVFKIKI